MSAWMCSKAHIDLMVRVARVGPKEKIGRWEFVAYDFQGGQKRLPASADELGRMLVKANGDSLVARYGPQEPERYRAEAEAGEFDHLFGSYCWEDPGVDLLAVEAMKLIDCYDYQSCEVEGWRGGSNETCEFCQALLKAVLYGTGYDMGKVVPSKHFRGEMQPAHMETALFDQAPWGFEQAHIDQMRLGQRPRDVRKTA